MTNQGQNKIGLARLLNHDENSQTSSDFTKTWPDQFIHVEGSNERLEGLTNYSFSDLVKMEKGQTRAYRVVGDRTIRMRITAGQEAALYDSGFTIYFIDLRSPELDLWLRALESDLGLVPGAARISAFASRLGDGLSAHFDGNDNFICHARGTKIWKVAENTHVRYPNAGYVIGEKMMRENLVEAPEGYPAQMPADAKSIEMKPGSVMFMPRGIWHSTETVEGESLHFNIRAALPVWRELLDHTIKHSRGQIFDELREPITDFLEADSISDEVQVELKEKIKQIADVICSAEKPLRDDVLLESLVRSRRV